MHHVLVFLFVLSKLLFEGAYKLLLLLLCRLRLQLVDRSDKSIFELGMGRLILLFFIHSGLEVAVKEVQAWDTVPRLKHVSVKDHYFLVVKQMPQ